MPSAPERSPIARWAAHCPASPGKYRKDEPDDHRGVSAGGGAFPRVESADDAGARAAQEDGAGHREELQDKIALLEIVAEEPCEDRNERNRPAKQVHLRASLDGLVVDGQNDILNTDCPPAMQVGGVGGDHQEDHQCAEDSGHADGKDVAQRDGHEHLGADGSGGLLGLDEGSVGRLILHAAGFEGGQARLQFGKFEVLSSS